MINIDVTEVVKEVRENLDSYGFKARDADGSDYQRGSDSSLRFKVGTKYGEVTVAVYRDERPEEYLRATTLEQVGRLLADVEKTIVRWEATR